MYTDVIVSTVKKFKKDDDMLVWDRHENDFKYANWEEKDFKFELIKGAMLAMKRRSGDKHLIPEHTPVSNQGRIGSCVANAAMDMFEILLGVGKGSGNVIQLSRLFAYWISRRLHMATDKDEGTFLRSMFQQMRAIGVVPERYFPYREDLVYKPPGLSLYTMASNNRIDSFYRITAKGDEKVRQIKTAISADHPVAYAAPVNKHFCEYEGGDQVWPRKMPKPIGNHAMLLVGWREVKGRLVFWNRNSWSKMWGDGGHNWMSADFIAEHAFDIWVGTRLKGLV